MNTDDVSRDLARAFPAAPGDLSRLRGRLAADSQRDGILDVAYRIVGSPVGPLLLAATEQGLVRVAYAREDHDAVLQALADKVSPRILHAPARLDLAARELEETSRAAATPSTCRWTGGCRPGSGAPSLVTCLRSATAIPPATPPLLSWPGIRRRSAPSAAPARPTPSRSWCPAIASSAPTAAWAATSAAPTPSAPCSPWRQHDPRQQHATGPVGGTRQRHRLGQRARRP